MMRQGADSCFWFYSDGCVEAVLVATAWVEGWIARDVQQLCDNEDDESDDGDCGDLASKYNELASKYNELASKYNELASKYNENASFPVIITGREKPKL